MTSAKITNVPIGGTQFDHHSKIGGAFFGAFNFSLSKSFRVLANGIWGQGNGRYSDRLGTAGGGLSDPDRSRHF